MGTEIKTGQDPTTENTEMTPPVTVSMKKLIAGVGTVFAGVLEMLEALEPQAAKQLMDRVIEHAGEESNAPGVAVTAEKAAPMKTAETAVPAEENTAEQAKTKESVPVQIPDPVQAPDQTQTVTVDDITKIIVRKVKQDRTNNEKIGAILKTYGVARVSELPTAKYEAFLTDISQL